jgi:OFA family oxalate/formate antiporter-like MFS transporter
MIVAAIYDSSQSYDTTFYVFAALLAVALVTTVFIRLNIYRIRAAKAAQASEQTVGA